jgi:hypothetical protein
MKGVHLLSIRQCNSWVSTILEDDLSCITRDLRGNYKRNLFYEIYPDLELQAKAFALENMSQ